jgi:acyl-coenzyme A synthetase/AMP-(fatty) acid ligase
MGGADAAAGGTEGFQEGWYYPGDIAVLDAKGYLTLKARAPEVIRRRGVEIYPAEIEAVLAQHPSVAEAVVVGVTPPGQEVQVIAVMVPRGKAQLEAVAQHCRERLPPEKFPNQLYWAEQLPRTGPGKVDRPALVAGLLKQLATIAPQAQQ